MVDSGSDRVVHVGRRGAMVRIHVRGVRVDRRATLRELRAIMVADLLRRVTEELSACQVFTTLLPSELPERPNIPADLAQDLSALWIQTPSLATAPPRETAHVVIDVDGSAGDVWEPVRVVIGPVDTDQGPSATLADLVAGGRDPLEVRLALLGARHDHPVSVREADLARAAETLGRWRDDIAAWARHPSAAMPQERVDRAYHALEDNLDAATVLHVLASIADDPDVPEGAKFETFVHLDRFLSLDLARGLAVSHAG